LEDDTLGLCSAIQGRAIEDAVRTQDDAAFGGRAVIQAGEAVEDVFGPGLAGGSGRSQLEDRAAAGEKYIEAGAVGSALGGGSLDGAGAVEREAGRGKGTVTVESEIVNRGLAPVAAAGGELWA
jgi:hypothetical protein